ncbi:MAG: cupredoxin domain-containing protein [Pyrinomonadaceae bacterium]|nr:cupredoxin domain-containing protein [Pyrinomonadaceae bacterium]MCX7639018.1 cupredoxin domain-containing protein [Pyrinomonadaceae bacterium]MDW8303762.1 cupredoxin domain-containing protein [Acidobacteriota bacterium]
MQKNEVQSFSVEIIAPTEKFEAGKPSVLKLSVKNDQDNPVKLSPKDLKLFLISENLDYFNPLEFENSEDGILKTEAYFPSGGNYKLYVILKPKNAEAITRIFDIKAEGNTETKSKITPDEKLQKQIDGLTVAIKNEGTLLAGRTVVLKYKIVDTSTREMIQNIDIDGKAFTVAVNENLNEFLYMEIAAPEKAQHQNHHDFMPESEKVSFYAEITFPKEGIYKLWTQFPYDGRTITVPFTVKVEPDKDLISFSDVRIPEGAFKVLITNNGFRPKEIFYKKGKPLSLAFVRFGDENCGNEISFSKIGLKLKEIPVGEAVIAEIPTEEEGTIVFSCGKHLGKIKIEK